MSTRIPKVGEWWYCKWAGCVYEGRIIADLENGEYIVRIKDWPCKFTVTKDSKYILAPVPIGFFRWLLTRLF